MSRLVRVLKGLGVALLLGVLGISALVTTLQSDWGRNRLRVYLEESVTAASGGRVEIGDLQVSLWSLSAELRDLVFHGKESPEEPPLFRARLLRVDATVLSWWGRKFRVERVDVEAPVVRIAVYPDGTSNLPTPDGPSDGPPVTHTLIDLGVRRFAISDGQLDFVGQRTPIHLKGEDLDLSLGFQEARELYQGRIAARSISLETSALEPVPFLFESEISLQRDKLEVTNGKLAYRDSQLTFSSTVTNFEAPEIHVPFQGSLRIADVQREFGLPVEPVGQVDATGDFHFVDSAWSLNGQVQGQDLGLRSGAVQVAGVKLNSRLALRENSFVFEDLAVDALGGKIAGTASFLGGNTLEMRATATGLGLDRLSRAGGMGELDYHSQVSGDLQLRAEFGPRGLAQSDAEVAVQLRPTQGARPLSGELQVAFSSRDGMLRFRDSLLELPQSHVRVDGDLVSGLRVETSSRSLDDFLPALALVSQQPESLLPVRLGTNGELGFRGIVSGTWQTPSIQGNLHGRNLQYEGRSLDSIELRMQANRDSLTVDDLSLDTVTSREGGVLPLPWTSGPHGRRRLCGVILTCAQRPFVRFLRKPGRPNCP